ncbi:MAG: S26 family signal peptidase [Planctomycetota bacterium]
MDGAGSQRRGAARVRGRRLAIGLGVTVGAVGLGLLVCRSVVGWGFPVASGSMEPTIMTGETVFLRYDDSPPDLFEIIAYTDVGGGASIKRCVGRPSDKFRIDASGDLRIDGRTVIDHPRRPGPIPMFDASLQSIGDHWRRGAGAIDPWSRALGTERGPDEVWEMDGSAVGRGADLGLLRLHDRIDDGRLLPDGTRVPGKHTVHDVAVSFEVWIAAPGGRLRVQLTDQGDVFEASVPVYAGEQESRIDLFRTSAEGIEYLVVGRSEVPVGAWIPVRMENFDNRVTFEFAGVSLRADYDRNAPHPTAFDLQPKSTGSRVRLGGEGIEMRVRGIVVERDVHWVPRGEFGVERELTLDADEVFVLGDASGDSRDSRDRGPIELDRVFGRAKAVVWPLSGARRLR